VNQRQAKSKLKTPALLSPATRRSLRQKLLRWYDANKRDLPWRATCDPYCTWISEIMLQQTRVAAATDYYLRFLRKFPTIECLAAAPLDSVLSAWSGLGYYRRARMMHQAAQKIVNELQGEFPRSAEALLPLPGIGRYTAAAIASIAFAQPAAVVDGNVDRVLRRLSSRPLDAGELWPLANLLLDPDRPGDFNQAMMELGATVCLPKEPDCRVCPIVPLCATRGPLAAGPRQTRLKREICYALGCRNGSIFMVQRSKDASLMAGMWELPEVSLNGKLPEAEFVLKHSITVTDYAVKVVRQLPPRAVRGRWLRRERLPEHALTGLARKILRRAQII
jgi:A/G-specific adenine glycosylase